MELPPPPPPIRIVYVGGPTAVIEIAGLRFVTDPTFAVPGSYASGAVTLTKTEPPAITLDELGPVDRVLLSHDQHADNLDPAGRTLVARVPTLTTQSGAERLGGPAIGLAPWQSHDVPAADGTVLRVTATPARHGPAGIERLVGEVIGFVVSTVEPPRDLVYVTGDTVWYGGTAEVARRFQPAVVLLFGGAARTRGPFHLTMDTNDAVEAAVAFPTAAIVPVHHAGWAHFTQSQDDLQRTFDVVGIGDRLRRVSAGTAIEITAGTAARSPSS